MTCVDPEPDRYNDGMRTKFDNQDSQSACRDSTVVERDTGAGRIARQLIHLVEIAERRRYDNASADRGTGVL